MPAVAGCVAITRRAVVPAGAIDPGATISSAGSGVPHAAQTSANAPDVGHRWAPDGHAGVAPRIRTVAAVSATPHVADAESGDEADVSIHAEHLAVVARLHPSGESRRGWLKARPEHPGGGGQRAGPSHRRHGP
jgi:hypothetical protein